MVAFVSARLAVFALVACCICPGWAVAQAPTSESPEPSPPEDKSQLTADLSFEPAGVDIRGQLKNLGSFEKRALDTALKNRKLKIDLEPHGKVLGEIHVANLNIFGEDDGPLTFFNIFHVTTREYVIEREVLLRPGQQWSDVVIQETRRRLTDTTWTAYAVLAPVVSDEPGKVDLLVVTRDIWSLRTNSNYEIAGNSTLPIPGFGGRIISFLLAPSENNLFGLRKQLAAVFELDLGQWRLGPLYNDPRMFGTRLQFAARAQAVFSRESSDFEGTTSSATLTYPLWSYRRAWGASTSISHFDAPSRQFEGFNLLGYDNPDTPEEESVPRIYDYFVFNFTNSVTRSFGYDWKSNFSLGHRLRVARPEVQDDFQGDAVLRSAFERDVLPRSERSSSLILGYSFFTPKFITYRNVNSYSLAEDVRLGPSVSGSMGLARKEIGSENNFLNLSAGVSWTQNLFGDGFVRASLSASTRIEDGDAKDNTYVFSGRVVPPRLFGWVRLVGRFAYHSVIDNENNQVLFLGGSSALRGYDVGAYRGDTRFIGNLELRSPPLRVWFMQWGAITFWDFGHAATAEAKNPISAIDSLSLKHDVGAGLRMLMPQLQPIVFSFDFAYALNEPPAVPGVDPPRFRIVLFVDQAF